MMSSDPASDPRAATKPFLFDATFDLADDFNQTPKRDAPPPEPVFSPADLEAARTQAHAEGHAAGIAETTASAEHATADALRGICDALNEIGERQTQACQTLREQAAVLALTAVRRIFPALADRHGLDEIEAFLADCLNHVGQLPRITVRVPENVGTEVEQRLSTLVDGSAFEGRFAVESDSAMGPGDCRIVWDDGAAERDAERVWSEIDAAVERFLGRDVPLSDGAIPGPEHTELEHTELEHTVPDAMIDDAPESTADTDDRHPTTAESADAPATPEAAAAPDAPQTEPDNPE